jgi:ATP-dependent Clp protease ATP-binding subunit ClpC
MAQSADTRQAISLAIDEARKLGHKYVGTEHLLLGILREGSNLPAKVLSQRGVKLESLREEILTLLRSSTHEDHAPPASGHDAMEWIHQQELAKAFHSPKFWHRLIMAVDSANRLGHGEIKDEHLLLAILRDGDSFVTQMLADKGVTVDWVRDRITRSAI